MYIPQVVRKPRNEGRGVEVENCGVRHAPDADAEKGWRVAFVDRYATIFCFAGRISWRRWGWVGRG